MPEDNVYLIPADRRGDAGRFLRLDVLLIDDFAKSFQFLDLCGFVSEEPSPRHLFVKINIACKSISFKKGIIITVWQLLT